MKADLDLHFQNQNSKSYFGKIDTLDVNLFNTKDNFFVSLILDSTPRLLFGFFESGFDNEFVIKSYTMEVDSGGEWKTVMSGQTDTYTSTFDYFKWN